jgi:uncharacterized protein (TIGR03437 family)
LNRFLLFVAVVLAVAAGTAPRLSAQTPVNISIVSGNGQVTCPLCPLSGGLVPPFFDGLYVKVTDASGNPVPNTAVNWTVVSGNGQLSNGASTDQTITNAQGVATDTYQAFNQITGTLGNPFNQGTITATISSGAGATFYETQAYANITGQGNSASLVQVQLLTPGSVPPCSGCLSPGDLLTGNAGGTSSNQFKVQVYVQGSTTPVVPNVSLQLVPCDNNGCGIGVIKPGTPTISCATGAGADPGTVLTDSTGVAVCTPILGSVTGSGRFYALVGGVASTGYNTGGPPQGYFQTGTFGLNVLPGVASSLSIVSGNGLSALPGQQVPGALIAKVGDAAGNPLSGQQVVWSVSPSSAATLSNTTTTSDANGRVQTNVTLSNSASGTVLVKVTLASNPNVSTTFSVTANVQITGLQVVSGNSQTALINTAFAQPLVVQLTSSTGSPASGLPVSFSISGPGTLTASTATTDSTGKASTGVIAGSTPGAVTVTASAGGQSASFNLTVIPQGPQITSNSFYNGADFQQGSISPCSVATIIAPGIAAAIQGTAAYSGVGALPYTLGGDSVTFGGAQTPIYNVANVNGQQQVTVQVPCSVTPGTVPVVVSVGGGTGTANATVLPASPGLFMTTFSNAQIPVLERPDGSFVSPANPAHAGETLIAFVTGLGATTPAVATNALPAPGSNPVVQGTVVVGMNGGGVPLNGTAESSDIVGVETVSFVVPSSTPAGNATFSVTVIPQGSSKGYNSALGIFPVH